MAKIKYRITAGFGERRLFTHGDDPITEISFTEPADGYVTVGNLVATVKEGVCRVDLRRLADGEYEPIFYSPVGRVRLEGIILRGGRILPSPTSEYALRRLFEKIDALEERTSEMEALLASLLEKTEKRIEF